MDIKSIKDNVSTIQNLSKVASYILDNPDSKNGFAVCTKDVDGSELMYFCICTSREDAENSITALNNQIEACKSNGGIPAAPNGATIKEIPDIKKLKTYLVKATSSKLLKLAEDNSEPALHILTGLAHE